MKTRKLRSLFMAAVMAAASVPQLLTVDAFAAGEVAIDETNFPDEVFRTYVADNCDTDSNGLLSVEEISAVTSITISTSEVSETRGELSDLKGIEIDEDL